MGSTKEEFVNLATKEALVMLSELLEQGGGRSFFQNLVEQVTRQVKDSARERDLEVTDEDLDTILTALALVFAYSPANHIRPRENCSNRLTPEIRKLIQLSQETVTDWQILSSS